MLDYLYDSHLRTDLAFHLEERELNKSLSKLEDNQKVIKI